jgi:nucleoside-diphosphate-sugar epimerase
MMNQRYIMSTDDVHWQFTPSRHLIHTVISHKMPSVQAPAMVLVSGTNGYVAIWVMQNLLSKGYSVCGTVHSVEKGEHLKKLFTNYGDKHEVVIVSDIMKVNLASTYMIHPLEQQAHRKEVLTRL